MVLVSYCIFKYRMKNQVFIFSRFLYLFGSKLFEGPWISFWELLKWPPVAAQAETLFESCTWIPWSPSVRDSLLRVPLTKTKKFFAFKLKNINQGESNLCRHIDKPVIFLWCFQLLLKSHSRKLWILEFCPRDI